MAEHSNPRPCPAPSAAAAVAAAAPGAGDAAPPLGLPHPRLAQLPTTRCVLDGVVPRELARELVFVYRACSTVGYRPHVCSATIHDVAHTAPCLLPPLLRARALVLCALEEQFGLQMELCVEFSGLIGWRQGADLGWHHDANRPYLARRHLSAVLYLNDQGVDFGEGEFRFQDGSPPLRVAPVAGRLVAYTADARNVHRVDRVAWGERVTLTLWASLDPAAAEDGKVLDTLLRHQQLHRPPAHTTPYHAPTSPPVLAPAKSHEISTAAAATDSAAAATCTACTACPAPEAAAVPTVHPAQGPDGGCSGPAACAGAGEAAAGVGAAAPHKRRRMHQGAAAASEDAASCDEQQHQHRLGTAADGKDAALLSDGGATQAAPDVGRSTAPDPGRGPADAAAEPRDGGRRMHTRYTCSACRGRLPPPPGPLLQWSGPPLGPGLPDAMYGTAQQQQQQQQQEQEQEKQEEGGSRVEDTEEQGHRLHIAEKAGGEEGQGGGMAADSGESASRALGAQGDTDRRSGGGGGGARDGGGGDGGMAPDDCSWTGPVCGGAVEDLRLQRLRDLGLGVALVEVDAADGEEEGRGTAGQQCTEEVAPASPGGMCATASDGGGTAAALMGQETPPQQVEVWVWDEGRRGTWSAGEHCAGGGVLRAG